MSSTFLDAFLHAGSFDMHGTALAKLLMRAILANGVTSEVGIELVRSWLAVPISLFSNDLRTSSIV